jgi:hypothetical protein
MRKSQGNTSIFQLLDKVQKPVGCRNVDEGDLAEVHKHPLDVRSCIQCCSQRLARVADACEEKVSADPPDQQSRKCSSFGMTLNVVVRFTVW